VKGLQTASERGLGIAALGELLAVGVDRRETAHAAAARRSFTSNCCSAAPR
jgi:hypothetical protein